MPIAGPVFTEESFPTLPLFLSPFILEPRCEVSVLNGTLVEVGYPPGRRLDALALLDALRPVDPEEIDFAR